MHATGDYTIAGLAELFTVSRPTVYRALGRQTGSPASHSASQTNCAARAASGSPGPASDVGEAARSTDLRARADRAEAELDTLRRERDQLRAALETPAGAEEHAATGRAKRRAPRAAPPAGGGA